MASRRLNVDPVRSSRRSAWCSADLQPWASDQAPEQPAGPTTSSEAGDAESVSSAPPSWRPAPSWRTDRHAAADARPARRREDDTKACARPRPAGSRQALRGHPGGEAEEQPAYRKRADRATAPSHIDDDAQAMMVSRRRQDADHRVGRGVDDQEDGRFRRRQPSRNGGIRHCRQVRRAGVQVKSSSMPWTLGGRSSDRADHHDARRTRARDADRRVELRAVEQRLQRNGAREHCFAPAGLRYMLNLGASCGGTG